MSKKRVMKNRISALLLALALVVTAFVPVTTSDVYAAKNKTSSAPAVTEISGYPTSINKKYSSSVKIKTTIRPANGGRKVKLQRYSTKTGKWTTISSVRTASADSAEVTFSIPKKQRKKTTSVWRIKVSKTNSAAAARSSNITLTTRNIKSYSMSARSACIYRIDENGKGTLIYTKKPNTIRAQASTTKLMTAILLIESGLLDSTTKISSHAAATPWGSGRLAKGDIYNTRDLLFAMLLPSSNDAATAVAERVGGSESDFVMMMNDKAASMGLKNTHFRNPHGLDADGHYTTATELAKLTAYAYTFPEIRQCWATKYKTICSVKKKRKWTLWSTNAIFSYVKNFLGGKTGTEDNAGCCFTGIYTYKGSTYVTVVLGSGYGFSRWSDTKKLHKYIRKYAAKKY